MLAFSVLSPISNDKLGKNVFFNKEKEKLPRV